MDAMSPAVDSIRILAVDDHPLFRSGIAALLATQPDMSLVAVASSGREAIEQFRLYHPDITLMDLQMREMDGLEAIIAIRREFPEARVIVLTTFEGDAQMLRAMNVGARAYLLKTRLDKELVDTIRAVHAGKKTLSAEADDELAEQDADERLTPLEIDVLQVIATGSVNKQIARLSITGETVKGRVKNILSKLAQMIVPTQR